MAPAIIQLEDSVRQMIEQAETVVYLKGIDEDMLWKHFKNIF